MTIEIPASEALYKTEWLRSGLKHFLEVSYPGRTVAWGDVENGWNGTGFKILAAKKTPKPKGC
jgi:hypothetical protein